MQLIAIAILAGLLLGGSAEAQSLSPMHNKGTTPSQVKGFSLTVGNPYKKRMTFVLVPMEPGFSVPAAGTEVRPASLTLAPGYSRRVVVAFKILPGQKERTIGLCVMPKDLPGAVLPRVCGTYTGQLLGGDGG